MIIPSEAPLADDVDFEQLARFEMTGGNIKSAVFKAASRVALRGDGEKSGGVCGGGGCGGRGGEGGHKRHACSLCVTFVAYQLYIYVFFLIL